MVIYSIIPEEQIFAEQLQTERTTQEIQLAGMILEVEPLGSFEAKIVRMISPNASDYLNPLYAPGQLIRFQPK